jgi:hypothetical protein
VGNGSCNGFLAITLGAIAISESIEMNQSQALEPEAIDLGNAQNNLGDAWIAIQQWGNKQLEANAGSQTASSEWSSALATWQTQYNAGNAAYSGLTSSLTTAMNNQTTAIGTLNNMIENTGIAGEQNIVAML